MKYIALLVYAFTALIATSAGAQSSTEWRHNKTGYNPLEPVQIKLESGSTVTSTPTTGGSPLSSTGSPDMLVMAQGSTGFNYNFDFAIRIGTTRYMVREANLNRWMPFTAADFDAKFNIVASEAILSLPQKFIGIGSGSYSFSASSSISISTTGQTINSTSKSCNICAAGACDSASSNDTSLWMPSGNVWRDFGADSVYGSCVAGGNNGMDWMLHARGFYSVSTSYDDGFVSGSVNCSGYMYSIDQSFPKTGSGGSTSGSGSISASCSGNITYYHQFTGGKNYGAQSNGASVRFYRNNVIATSTNSTHNSAYTSPTNVYVIPSLSLYFSTGAGTNRPLFFSGQFDKAIETITTLTAAEHPTLAVTGLTLK
jgi:hypothetical protein